MSFTEQEINSRVEELKARGESSDRIVDFVQKARALSDVSTKTNYAAPREGASNSVPERELANKAGGAVSKFVSELGAEGERQYIDPIRKMASGDRSGGANDLLNSLQPSIRMSPMLLPGMKEYRALTMAQQAAVSAMSYAGTTAATGGTIPEQTGAAISAFGSGYNPGFAAAKSEWARRGQYIGSAALGGVVQGATEFAAEMVRGKDRKEAMSSAQIPALVGTFFGFTGQLGKTFEAYADESRAAQKAFGADTPPAVTSPTVLGGVAAKAERMGADVGIADLERKVGDQFVASLGNQVDGAEVATRLQKYSGALDEGQVRLASMSQESLLANEQLAAAQAALNEGRANVYTMTDQKLAALTGNLKEAANRAAAAQAKDIASKAYQIQQASLKGNYVAPATARNFFVENVMKPLDDHIKQRAKVLNEAIGVPSNTEFISGEDVWARIQETKSYQRSGGMRNEDVDSIVLPLLQKKDKNGEIEFRALSRDDVQFIRQKMWDMHEADIPGAPKAETAALKEIDFAIKSEVEKSMEAFKPDSVVPLKEFNSYWASMAEAKSSRGSRALFVNDPSDDVISKLTAGLIENGADGKAYTGLIKYIDAAAAGNTQVQQGMKSHVFGLLRDNIVTRHYNNKNPLIGEAFDLAALSADVTRLQKGGFPVEQLGLDRDIIYQAARLSGNAGLGRNITAQEFHAIMQNPAVLQAKAQGMKTEPIVARIANELGAIRAFKEGKWHEITNKTEKSRKSLAIAEERAKRAGLELRDIEKSVGDMSNDPIFRAFGGGKNFGISKEGHADFTKFLSYIGDPNRTTSGDVTSLLSAIEQKAPEMREQIALHTMSRTIEFLSKNQMTGERGVDWKAMGQFIDPSNPVTGEMFKNRIRTIVGTEAFSKLMDNMPRIEIMRKLNVQREAVAAGRQNISEIGTAGRGVTQAASGQGFGATLRSIGDLVGRGEYHLAAMMLSIPGADKALKAGASIGEIVEKLGPQRAYIMYQNMPQQSRP